MARPPKAKAIERLQRALDIIPELKELQNNSQAFKKWVRDTQVTLRNTFGDNSTQHKEFKRIGFSPTTISIMGTPNSIGIQKAYVRGLESAAAVLESMIEEIKEYWEDEKQTTSSSTRGEKQQDRDRTLKSSSAPSNDRSSSKKVFVIHGRDEGAKQTVARFLETLDLEPVILHEQANLGRTIIEKFEDHADVGFAVVLLTPDDVGSLKNEKPNLKSRARQNVIFEFGYFIGNLGRERVCALVKSDVEKPSDYDGVLYIPLDGSDGWKMRLIKELKSAGYEVDANRAL